MNYTIVYICIMIKTIEEYKTVEHFAKGYVKRNNQVGVTRHYIYQLIHKEEEQPGSTDLDILVVDGTYFVRHRED